jgi:hypothetical protein
MAQPAALIRRLPLPLSSWAGRSGPALRNGIALPAELLTTQTTSTPNKSSIKARIRAVIAAAVAGLPKPEAAHLAFSLAATAVPGARLIKRRHWSIT